MDEFLQRAKSKLNRSKRLEKVHVVIGHKSCDLDSLISAFTYAYFLEKVSPPGVLCLPVLNIPRTEFNYFTETRFILEELNISESVHIFRDEINLHQLNNEGKLSLTLVGSNVLASEDKTLESAVVKVISPVEQSDAGVEFQESSSSLVVKEILQEAPELITEQLAHLLRGSILFQCLNMESETISEKQEKILSILEEKFPNLPPREAIIRTLQETQFSAQGLSIEQTMLKDLKELSDGEIKVAVSTVNMTLENCMFHRNITSDLKAFADKYGFDVLILLASYQLEEQLPRQQIAVYSENLELCSQICCELEECQNPCLELDPFECGCDEILVYQQENPSVTCDQIVLLVKEVINRRCPEMASNSRTSSTEAVAGSAPLSQGSSGIMELYGSDIEPQPSSVNFIENPPGFIDSNQAQVDVNIDLVSPDSGLATIRSSRSSKESSVFLSDDSPVGEGAGPHHSLLPGFDSYSPIPEGAVVEEHTRAGEHGEHFDLFNFDSAPMVSGQSQPSSHSADFSPEDDFFPNSDSSEGQLPTEPKGLDDIGINMSSYSSSSLLSTAGKDSLVEFDEEFIQRQESPRNKCERNLNLTDFVGDESASPERLKNIGKRIPPTPMNSFVESSPSTEEHALLYTEDTTQNAVDKSHTGPPQSRARCSSWWGGLEIDSKNITDAWSSSEQESVFQSPESWKDHKPSLADRRTSDSVFQAKSLAFSKSGTWESEFGQPVLGSSENQDQTEENLQPQNVPTEKSHLSNGSSQGTNHLIENFSALWHSDRSPTTMPEPWGNPTDDSEPGPVGTFPAWSAFGKEDDMKALKNTWNLHPMSNETHSVMDPNEWTMAKSGFSFPSEDLLNNSASDTSNGATPEIWGRKNNDCSGNPSSTLDHAWNHSKPPKEDPNGLVDPKIKENVYEKVDSWNLFEESIKKGGSDALAPWEDSFLSYKCSDYSASNIGEDSVASPLDTNYSTSESYTSPTFAGDEKEAENKPFDKEEGFESKEMNSTAEEAEMPPQSPPQGPRNRISSGPGNLEMWTFPHADSSFEISDTHNSQNDFLQTEHKGDKNVSLEDDVGDSSQSSYDDPRMMQLYNETNRQLTLLHSNTNSRQGAPENLDTWNRVILEDTQSTATISDMDNDLDWDDCSGGVAIPNEGQAQEYTTDGIEPETRFSVKQLEPWSVEYPEANQVDWEHPASSEPGKDTAPNEYHILSEKSGQLIANSIWDSVMKDNGVSSLMSPSPSHIMDSEQSKSTLKTPGSSERIKDSHSPQFSTDVLDASASSQSDSPTPDPDNEDLWSGTLQGDAASLANRLENPERFVHSDLWKGHSYGQIGSEKEGQAATDLEYTGEEEVDSTSESSGKGAGDQELSSPVASEQEIDMELGKISSPSVASSPPTEELEGDSEHKKGSYTLDSYDVQTGMSTEKHLLNEATDVSDRITVTENVPLSEMSLEKMEECNSLEPERMNEMPHHEFPQSLAIWDGPKENDVQVNCTHSEITENLEVKHTENSLSGASSPGKYSKGSISSEYTHSSASSPELNDSSAALLSWRPTTNAEHKKENQDDWNGQNQQESEAIAPDGQVEVVTEMKNPEKDRMEKFEKNFDHKMPKFLEIWNYSVDGDSLSSLSSPETGKISEYSDAYQQRNLVVSYQEKNECDIQETMQPEAANFISTSSDSDDSSADDEESVEKEGYLDPCQDTLRESRAWNSLTGSHQFLATGDLNIQESSEYIDSSEPVENESKSNSFHDDPQSSPDHWNFSPPLDSLDESNKCLATVDTNVQKCSEYINSSEPAENENKSKPFHDDQQNSPDHWNFSPQLESLNESSKFLATSDTNHQEGSEYISSSEPAESENQSKSFHDDQQSSLDHWNFLPLNESSKFLGASDTHTQECSEYVSSSEPTENENQPNPFHDDQQSSPNHWNFSPQLESLNESSKFLATSDTNNQETSEYVSSSEPAENENQSKSFHDDQQSSLYHQNFSPLNESSKFLAISDTNTQESSEDVDNSKPAENENQSNPFRDDQQSSPDHWNFLPLNESNKFLATSDTNTQESSEYTDNLEPAENENQPNLFPDDQQSSPDHWNFSPLNESNKFLATSDTNSQESSEYVDNSEPAENEIQSSPIHDDQQRSPGHWNVSPQLESLNESSKFLATSDTNTQKCSEYVSSSEPVEKENQSNPFHDDQQSSPDHWNFLPLNESNKFLATSDANTQESSEYLDNLEPAENENQPNLFPDDQQSSPDHWNFSPLNESNKFLATSDTNSQESSEYVDNSEPAENEIQSSPIHDDQQRSPGHWNVSPQLESLNESSKFLATSDTNNQEGSEYVSSSEPAENENQSNPFHDGQQSSPDHWNFSLQLESLNESSKFLATSDTNNQEGSEYVRSSEPAENENQSNTFHDDQQSSPDHWNFSPLNESCKFLDTSKTNIQESSEYVDNSEPAENETQSSPFHNGQQSDPDHWNVSPLKETEIQTIAMNRETNSSPEVVKTGDICEVKTWQISPQTEPQTSNTSKLERLGFSAENVEWWTASPQEGRPTERAFERELSNSSDVLEKKSSVYQNVDPWGVPIRGDVESMETHCANPFKDKHQATFLDSNGKNSQELLWNIQPKELDSDADELNQLEILDQIKEKDSREQISISSAADELTSETHTPEQCQDTILPGGDQPDPMFTGENECVISHVSTFECQETNWWEQEESYTSETSNSNIASENVPVVSSPTQLMSKSHSGWRDSNPSESPQGTFVPDILPSNFQEPGQLASASPDLWMDAKQPLSSKAGGENPDILTHCDHESNSQASNSSDIYHDYEAKQETEHQISAWMGPEVESIELYVTEPKVDEEPSQEPGQELVPYKSGLYFENAIPLFAVSKQANSSSISQPASHEVSLEPSEINNENNTDSNAPEIRTSPDVPAVLESFDRTIPIIENMGTKIVVTHPEPALDGNNHWVLEDFAPESPRDARALLDYEQPFATENPAQVTDTLLVSDTRLDVSEAAFDHSFSDASGLNTSTGTIDDMSKLTLSEGNPDTPVDGDAGKQDICSSEASWGDFEYDAVGQNIDEDLLKESDHFLYGVDPPLEEDVLKQPLAPYTPPFDLSHLTEPTPGVEKIEEAGSPENESLGSEVAELLLSALPDERDKENHTETQSSQPGPQLVTLHIREDSESLSLPVRGGANVELSPSNDVDWDIETDHSYSPAGGDIGPSNGANKGLLDSEEAKITPTKDPEQLKSEYKEERCTEKNEDHHALHMDYILVNHEEHSPQMPEVCEARERTFEVEESHTNAEEKDLPEIQLPSFKDTFKSASLNESKDHSLARLRSTEDKTSSPESPGQDQGWMVLNHNEVGDPMSEEGSSQPEARISGSGWSAEAVEPASDPSPGKGYQMQVLGEVKPIECLALEEASGLSSESRKTKSQGRSGPDAAVLQTVTHDNEWEMLSPQPAQINSIPEVEMEEETEFFEHRTRKPRPNGLLPEDVGMDIPFEEGIQSPTAADMRPEPPSSLNLNGVHTQRIKLTAPNINLSLDQSEGSVLSDDNLDSPDEIDINVDELDTPDEADSFEYTGHEDPTNNKDSGQESESIPEYTAEEEREDNRLWRTVVIGEQEQRIDMKVIEPYRRVISHGGYYGDGLNAIIVFAACFLPDSSRADYHYVMENLFLYVISTLELMVAEDYMIVYLNGATPRRKMPGLGWMKKCYQMIDRRLRKNLKSFIIVHPSWFIRTILAVTRPFISSKFSSKIKYVSSLSELSGLIPMDCIHIPESILKLDEELKETSEAAKTSCLYNDPEMSSMEKDIDLKLKEKP